MRGVRNVLNYLRHLSASKALVSGLFVLAVTVSGGALLYQQHAAQAASCSDNDIIRCGVSSGEDLRNKINQNATGDLPTIYAHYGASADEIANRAVEGTAYKDGTIKVNGRTVATDAMSLGRHQKSYSHPVSMGGETYHESRSQDVFRSDGLAVLVVLDHDNTFKYAIIKECGNPMTGNPTPPPVEPQEEKKYIEVCRDGEIITIREDEKHDDDLPADSDECKEKPAPIYQCIDLDLIRHDSDDDYHPTYRFEVTYRAENGAMLRDVDFDFDNGETEEGVESDGDNTATSREVTYSSAGEKTITATLYFEVDGHTKEVSSSDCEVTLTVPEKPEAKDITVCRDDEIITIPEDEERDSDRPANAEECQPKPVESKDIKVCRDHEIVVISEADERRSDSPVDSDDCKEKPEKAVVEKKGEETPPTIPSTGPAELAGSALGLSSLAGAGYYFRTSRRSFLAAALRK